MFIIALQYCDRTDDYQYPEQYSHAMDAALLYAQIEREPRKDVLFQFIVRFDATDPDPNVVAEVRKKFPVEIHRCSRRSVGWPSGPNAMWHETMLRSHVIYQSGIPIDAVLTTEPDAVPTHPDWINTLLFEWRARNSVHNPLCVMGHWYAESHFNGNALFHPCILNLCPALKSIPSDKPWDVWIGNELKHRGYDTPLIWNQYRKSKAVKADLIQTRGGLVKPVFIHGYKDDSARKIVRKMWKL